MGVHDGASANNPTTPPYQLGESYAQVPTSPGLSDSADNGRPLYVPSPLNPRTNSDYDRMRRSVGPMSLRSGPPSQTSSTMLGLSARSSGSNGTSHNEKDQQMQGIMVGNIEGGLGPYPPLSSPNSIPGPPTHYPQYRFSTVSSAGSVLGFSTDSKYAAPFLSSTLHPKPDLHSPHSLYGLYDRLDGPAEADDLIHEPGTQSTQAEGTSWRVVLNLAVLSTLIVGIVALFAGYPIIYHYTRNNAWERAHINGTGQIPALLGMPTLVDPATPSEFLTRTGFDGQPYELVFSDEFETPGRSFYPGDDPFWEAVDLWYKSTQDLEWYDPAQITTRDGHLVIVLDQSNAHPGLPFVSGMLQSWNKFCFTTGYIEVSVVFPGSQDVSGYWPGVWLMGNLARPGYGATGDGMWPYSYDACDVGTVPNQTLNGVPAAAATAGGNAKYNNNLSWLPGQKLSACTCPGEDHPGPNEHSKPAGRGAPEIDIFEAQKNKQGFGGRVTQSAQMAPFSTLYYFANTSADVSIPHPERTILNPYRGSALQQAISALTDLNATVFADEGAQFTKFAFEYWSNPSNRKEGYINWVADEEVFRIDANTFAADPNVGISDRLIAEEPMSIVLNLAVSESFQTVQTALMEFPSEFRIDYVRVYQRKGLGADALGCNPKSHPTEDYINKHPAAYTNAQATSWEAAGYTFPKNSLLDGPMDLCIVFAMLLVSIHDSF
ncbi:glycoside hydrolase family 16 protein [Hydnum rufescens UP504]|uniref:Glycoside hydrolase family 16 protein n=1 Tax=Hydnum rufescens UP504 TaxID=1448309 RepID=A0A9P6B1K7_9AGAM|nr:glycoside hydrolase family 16 protein [Hydnum rufescens UP504]